MNIFYHILLEATMAVFFWMRLYITFRKRRQEPEERRIDLITNATLALLFTVGAIDLYMTLPEIISLLAKLHALGV